MEVITSNETYINNKPELSILQQPRALFNNLINKIAETKILRIYRQYCTRQPTSCTEKHT